MGALPNSTCFQYIKATRQPKKEIKEKASNPLRSLRTPKKENKTRRN
jgi:hypothetical protein